MSEHTPDRAAAIVKAARAAGAIDPESFPFFVPPAEMVNPADAVAKLRAEKPHFFQKSALDMTAAELAAALGSIKRDGEKQRQAAVQTAMIARLSRKYAKHK